MPSRKKSLQDRGRRLFDSLEGEARDPKARHNILRFSAVFLIVFFGLTVLANPFLGPLWDGLGAWHAQAASSVLAVFGSESAVQGNDLSVDVQGEPVHFQVSQLCSGDVEIFLLVALLLASFDIALFWRLAGALAGIATILLVNPLRIAVTIIITQGSGLEAGDVVHSIIFRLFLFLLLVSYYFAWYRLTKGRTAPKCWTRFESMLGGQNSKR